MPPKSGDRKSLAPGSKYAKSDVLMLKQAYEQADINKDGRVLPKEVHACLSQHARGKTHVSALTVSRAMDINKDGVVSFDELLRIFFPLATPREMTVLMNWAYPPAKPAPKQEETFHPNVDQLSELKAMFLMYDKNKNGKLELQEVRGVADACGYDPDEAETLFFASDKDGDNSISFEEFVQMMKTSYL